MNNKEFSAIRKSYGDRTLLRQEKMQAIVAMTAVAKDISGDVAECGVFRGGSLKLLANVFPSSTIYGFDTFEGLPQGGKEDTVKLEKGRFACSLSEVTKYLSDTTNVRLIKGLFPETVINIPEEARFKFVHLDMDLYKPTLQGLKFFYARMNPGAVMIIDDYLHSECPGIQQALEEFFAGKEEVYFQIGVRQACFIKG